MALTVMPTAANAEIVPGTGIADISIGMQGAEVIAMFGDPIRTTNGTSPQGLPTESMYYPGKLKVIVSDGAVTTVRTRSRSERTFDGIGVGISKSQLRRTYSSATCQRIGTARSICQIGDLIPGEVVTTLRVHRRFITEVSVDQFLD